ncbi:MAG: SRPBCC family protein [Gemmatimonadales bacterium]
MRNVIRIILVVILLGVLFIQSRPDHFRVERSATMHAPAQTVYAHVVDFHQWPAWSPWEHLDPNMKTSYGGPPSGVGSSYHWSGNAKAGEGSMTITAADPGRRLAIDLEFLKPFKGSNVCTFEFIPDGEGTKVTWALDGKSNFISKAMCVFMSMDKMVGPDFERGLVSLKGVAEAAPATADSTSTAPAKAAAAK